MKIVQVNTICGATSTGRICVDLYETVAAKGQEPYIAVGRGGLPPGVNGYRIGNTTDFLCHVMKNFTQGKAGFGSKKVTQKFIAWLREIKPDIIHLHNIHGFYLQVELLFDYLKEAGIPVVWTLHDCWAFTGHCAYFDFVGCEKWKDGGAGCHNCPIHKSAYPYALFKDNTIWNYATKKRIFGGVRNLTIVTPSRWLAGLVKQSYLKEYEVVVIPNGINLENFKPLDKKQQEKREHQQAGYRHRTILGVANRWEPRKGLCYFEQLADRLGDNYTIELIGLDQAQTQAMKKKYPTGKILPLERTRNVELLAAIYRTADVFVNTTLEDNFPTTNLEALACGTPVITFDTGGSPESVDASCGIVVPKGDIDALLQAVLRVCEEKPFSAQDCRQRALLYDRQDRYMDYLHLYERVYRTGKDREV